MIISTEVPNFRLRARLVGTVEWVCVYCGTINKSKVPPLAYRLQCKNRDCHRKFLFGLKVYPVPAGGRVPIPPDMVIPRGEAFPEAEFAVRRIKAGKGVHELIAVDVVQKESTNDPKIIKE